MSDATAARAARAIERRRSQSHVKVLASDDFEDRAPATEGERKTVDYIVGQFKALGVQPGGAPERKWDDFKGVDLRGEIALVLITDPVSPAIGRVDARLGCGLGVHADSRSQRGSEALALERLAAARLGEPDHVALRILPEHFL